MISHWIGCLQHAAGLWEAWDRAVRDVLGKLRVAGPAGRSTAVTSGSGGGGATTAGVRRSASPATGGRPQADGGLEAKRARTAGGWGTVRAAGLLRNWALRAEHPSLGAARLEAGRAAGSHSSHFEPAGLWLSADRLSGDFGSRCGRPAEVEPAGQFWEEGWLRSAALGRSRLTLDKAKTAASGPSVLEGSASLARAVLHSHSLRRVACGANRFDEGGISRAQAKAAHATSGSVAALGRGSDGGGGSTSGVGAGGVAGGGEQLLGGRRRGWAVGVQELACDLRCDAARLLEVWVDRAAAAVSHNSRARAPAGDAGVGGVGGGGGGAAADVEGEAAVGSGGKAGVVRYRHVVVRLSGDTGPTLARIARRAGALFDRSAVGGNCPPQAGSFGGGGGGSGGGGGGGGLAASRGLSSEEDWASHAKRSGGRSGGGVEWWPGGGGFDSDTDTVDDDCDVDGDGFLRDGGGDEEADAEESGEGEDGLRGVLFSSRSPRRPGDGRGGRRGARWGEDCDIGGVPAGQMLVAGEVSPHRSQCSAAASEDGGELSSAGRAHKGRGLLQFGG